MPMTTASGTPWSRAGKRPDMRRYHDGPDFPWGLVILGGIGYVAWRKGAFDRFGGPGGPFNGGQMASEASSAMAGQWSGP